MQDYRYFTPEALATDPSFRQWVIGNNSEAYAFWNDWLAKNPDKKEDIEKAQALLKTINTQIEQRFEKQIQLSDEEIHTEIHRLHQSLNDSKTLRINWFHRSPIRYGIAASVLLILGLFSWYVIHPNSLPENVTYQDLVAQSEVPLVEVTNKTTKPTVVNLPDKSTILLYPNSRLSYAKSFKGIRREVYVSGEAFFDVAKNPSRPFYVYTNNLVTKVLGTSFSVQTNESTKQVKVVVKTGKVSVYARNSSPTTTEKEDYNLGGTVLLPNQQVVFSENDTRLIRSLVKEPALLTTETPNVSFVFKRTPIAEVFSSLEKAYNIRIIFDEDVMKDCLLTASFTDEPLFDKLALICRTINARYDQLDTYIVIDSKGCK